MMSAVGMPAIGPVEAEPAAPRAGADLRSARERLGWSLADVAAGLRIRVGYLDALEAGRLSALPGNAYALAFVRSYARLLGVDAEEMVRRIKAEAAVVGRRTELQFPVPMPERGLPAGAIMLLGLVLLVGAYAGWYRLSEEGRLPAEAVLPVPERLAAASDLALAPALAPVGGVPAEVPAHASGPAGTKAAAALAVPLVARSPMSAAAALPIRTPDAATPASLVAPAAAAIAPDPVGRIVLRASAVTWILVKDRSGSVILNRTLKPGDTWQAPPRTDLMMTTGNAGGTEVLVDGAAAPPLGGLGVVRHDLLLDADMLKAGKLPVVAPAPNARPRQ